MKYKDHQGANYYRTTFFISDLSEDEITSVVNMLEELEKEETIMRAFHRDETLNTLRFVSSPSAEFVIYYRESDNASVKRLLFKLLIKYPDLSYGAKNTYQEYN